MTLWDRLFGVRDKLKLAIRRGIGILSQRSLSTLDLMAAAIVRHDAPPPEQEVDGLYDLLDAAYIELYDVLETPKADAVLPPELIERLRNYLADLSIAKDEAGRKDGVIRMRRRGPGGWHD